MRDLTKYILFTSYISCTVVISLYITSIPVSVTYATDAVKLGVDGAFITDGRVPHALLNEILAGGEEGLGSGGGGTIVTL